MKKILFLTPFVPSKRAGGENFTRLLIEQLSINNKIDLLYYRYADDPYYKSSNGNIKVVREVSNSFIQKLKNFLMYPLIHPIFSIRFNRHLLKFIKGLVAENQYDLLYLDHSQMALYGKYFPEMRKVLMSMDVMAQRYSRKGSAVARKLILSGEGNLMSLPNMTVFSFSEKDKKIIKDLYGVESKVTNFILDKIVLDAKPIAIEKRIIFFGKWKRADNFDGLKWFFDNVYSKVPANITISIIGKWLPPKFEDLLKKFSNVEYLGFVDNPYSMIANSLATISPLFSGAGVKVKIIESLACGTPVVGNDIAFEGISEDFKEFMIHADSVDEFLSGIINMDISLERRQLYKQKFMALYQQQSICSFINQ